MNKWILKFLAILALMFGGISLTLAAGVEQELDAKLKALEDKVTLLDCLERHGGFTKAAYAACQKGEAEATGAVVVGSGKVFYWKKVGGNPVNRYVKKITRGKPHGEALAMVQGHVESLMKGMGVDPEKERLARNFVAGYLLEEAGVFTPEESERFRQMGIEARMLGIVQSRTFDRGDQFLVMSYGRGKVVSNVVADWRTGPENAIVITLTDKRRLVWFPACGNLGLLPPPKAPPEAPGVTPPGKPTVITPAPPTEEVVTPEREYLWDWDAFAFYGQDHGESRAQTEFWGVEAALYPVVIDTKGGRHEFGVGGLYNEFEGRAFDGFRFDGHQWGVAPAYKFYGQGWDFNLKAPMFGQLEEHGRTGDGRYRSRREFDLLGFGAGLNFYQRQVRGEKWFPETQVFTRMGFPIDSDVKHSWDGTPIADTRELEKFDGLINVGVRQILYDGEWVRPYLEAGYFGELPTNESLRLQVGISDRHKIIFAGIGPNFNLTQGGTSLLWSVGVDVANGFRYVRGEYRRDQFRKTLTAYDEETGMFSLPEETSSQGTDGFLNIPEERRLENPNPQTLSPSSSLDTSRQEMDQSAVLGQPESLREDISFSGLGDLNGEATPVSNEKFGETPPSSSQPMEQSPSHDEVQGLNPFL
jgi:hypothetical protein